MLNSASKVTIKCKIDNADLVVFVLNLYLTELRLLETS